MVNGNKRGQNLVGIVLTLIVITTLILSGPASAITLDITPISATDPYEYEVVGFQVSVDIDVGERIPVQNLTLSLSSSEADYSKNCTFALDGTLLEGELCYDIWVTPDADDTPYGYGYGEMYGYGYGPSDNYENTTFGYGYGYGYSELAQEELTYTVYWYAPDVDSESDFDVRLDANAQEGSTKFTYSKTSTSFFTVKDSDITAPAMTNLTISPLTIYNETYYVGESANLSANVSDLESGIDPDGCEYYNGTAWLAASYNSTTSLCYTNNANLRNTNTTFTIGMRVNDSFTNQANLTQSVILPTVDARNNLSYSHLLGSNTNESELTANLNLPRVGKFGTYTNLSWNSSNSAYLKNDGNVTRPAYGQPHASILLTATISKAGYTNLTKLFNLTILASGRSTTATSGGRNTPTFWTTTYAVDEFDFQTGYSKLLGIKQRLRIRVGSEDHYVGVVSLTSSQATINVSSKVQQAIFSIGDTNKFEVTNDTYYDLSVRLNSISGGKANLTVKELRELMPQAPPSEEEKKGEETVEVIKPPTQPPVQPPSQPPEKTPSTTSPFRTVILAIIVTVFLLVPSLIVLRKRALGPQPSNQEQDQEHKADLLQETPEQLQFERLGNYNSHLPDSLFVIEDQGIELPQSLLDYVRLATSRGLPDEEIKYLLLNRGWPLKQVMAAIRLVKR